MYPYLCLLNFLKMSFLEVDDNLTGRPSIVNLDHLPVSSLVSIWHVIVKTL